MTTAQLPQDASVTQGATAPAEAPRKALGQLAALFALFLVLGPVVVARIGVPGVLNPGTGVNTFFEQYRRHEPVFLALMAAFAVVAAVIVRRAVPDESRTGVAWIDDRRWRAVHL